jgi:hypothetical protein
MACRTRHLISTRGFRLLDAAYYTGGHLDERRATTTCRNSRWGARSALDKNNSIKLYFNSG